MMKVKGTNTARFPTWGNKSKPGLVDMERMAAASQRRIKRGHKLQGNYLRGVFNKHPIAKAAQRRALAAVGKGPARRAYYDGGRKKLLGELALIRDTTDPLVVQAQFDNPELVWRGSYLAAGWHDFPASDFVTTHSE